MDEIGAIQAQMQDMAQAAMGANMAREVMEFQGSMAAAIINGSTQGDLATRNAGLAAQGIGGKLNITV